MDVGQFICHAVGLVLLAKREWRESKATFLETHDVAPRRRPAICTDYDSPFKLYGHDRGLCS